MASVHWGFSRQISIMADQCTDLMLTLQNVIGFSACSDRPLRFIGAAFRLVFRSSPFIEGPITEGFESLEPGFHRYDGIQYP